MSRAVVVHFDGDPFTLTIWLELYAKYWRVEVDKVYLSIVCDRNVLPIPVINYNAEIISRFPEICVYAQHEKIIPELANEQIIPEVKEDYIGLIESDGLIFKSNLVDQCFRLLEKEGQDIVCPPWYLIDEPYINGMGYTGFMRCFFFIKREHLQSIEVDFKPKYLHAGETVQGHPKRLTKDLALDCFGWISVQLLLKRLNITIISGNVLTPDSITDVKTFEQWKWIHIRQMSSSALGVGGEEFSLWDKKSPELHKTLMRIIKARIDGTGAEFIYTKAIAFKLLFMEYVKRDLEPFTSNYEDVLQAAMVIYNLPISQIFEIKGFYRAMFDLTPSLV